LRQLFCYLVIIIGRFLLTGIPFWSFSGLGMPCFSGWAFRLGVSAIWECPVFLAGHSGWAFLRFGNALLPNPDIPISKNQRFGMPLAQTWAFQFLKIEDSECLWHKPGHSNF